MRNSEALLQEIERLEQEIMDCPARGYHEPQIKWCVTHDSPKDTNELRWHDDRCKASINSRECVFIWKE